MTGWANFVRAVSGSHHGEADHLHVERFGVSEGGPTVQASENSFYYVMTS